MSRNEFIKKIIRYLLFGILALIAFLTGSKAVMPADCSSCPAKGICHGENDCSILLSGKA